MKCYIPYESPYAKDSDSIHCLVLVAMVTMQGLWLAKHENRCNSKTKSHNEFKVGGMVDENIPQGLMEPDFLFGCHGNQESANQAIFHCNSNLKMFFKKRAPLIPPPMSKQHTCQISYSGDLAFLSYIRSRFASLRFSAFQDIKR